MPANSNPPLQTDLHSELPTFLVEGLYGTCSSTYFTSPIQHCGDRSRSSYLLSPPHQGNPESSISHEHNSQSAVVVLLDLSIAPHQRQPFHVLVRTALEHRLGYALHPAIAAAERRLESTGAWNSFAEHCQRLFDANWKERSQQPDALSAFSTLMHHVFPDKFATATAWQEQTTVRNFQEPLFPKESVESMVHMVKHRANGCQLHLLLENLPTHLPPEHQIHHHIFTLLSHILRRLRGRVWVAGTCEHVSPDFAWSPLFPESQRQSLRLEDIATSLAIQLGTTTTLITHHPEHLETLNPNSKKDSHPDSLTSLIYALPLGLADLEYLLGLTSSLAQQSRLASRPLPPTVFDLLGEGGEVSKLPTSWYTLSLPLLSWIPESTREVIQKIDEHPGFRGASIAGHMIRMLAFLEQRALWQPVSKQHLFTELGRAFPDAFSVEQMDETLRVLELSQFVAAFSEQRYHTMQPEMLVWLRERHAYLVKSEEVTEAIGFQLKRMMLAMTPAWVNQKNLAWRTFLADGKIFNDVLLTNPSGYDVIQVDYRFVPKEKQGIDNWEFRTSKAQLAKRLVWVVGDRSEVDPLAREWVQVQATVRRFQSKIHSLSQREQRWLALQEEYRNYLEQQLFVSVHAAFMDGAFFLHGRKLVDAKDVGASHREVLQAMLLRVGTELLLSPPPVWGSLKKKPHIALQQRCAVSNHSLEDRRD
jgi:hypothetical protein